MASAHDQVLRSQNFNRTKKANRYTNIVSQPQSARHIRNVAKYRKVLNIIDLEVTDSENQHRIVLPRSDYISDLHMIVKLKTITGGAKYVDLPAMNLFKHIALVSGNQKVQEMYPKAVFNYVFQTMDDQTYSAAKKMMGSGLAGASAGGEVIYPFPFAVTGRWANRNWRKNAPFPAGKLNISSLMIDITTARRQEIVDNIATCNEADLIDKCQLCWYAPILEDDLRNAELAKPFSVNKEDFRTRIGYTISNTGTDIDLSYLNGEIRCLVFDVQTPTQNANKQYYKRNELAAAKLEIDGSEYSNIATSAEQLVESFRDGIKENADGKDTKVSFAWEAGNYASNGVLNTKSIQKIQANVTAAVNNSTADVLAVTENQYSIRNGELRKD